MQNEDKQFSALEYFQSATLKMSQQEPLQALAICFEGLENYPDDLKISCQAARCCIALRRRDEARLYIDRLLKTHVGSADVLETHADLLLLEGMPAKALSFYRQALSLNAGQKGIQQKVDKCRERMDHMRPVTEGPRRQKLAFPEEMAQAGRLERDGDAAQAEDIYRSILRRYPKHVEAMRKLAAIASSHLKYVDAEVFLKEAVSVAPDYVRAWIDLSVVQLDLQKMDDAIASAERLMELAPDVAECQLAMGNALARADRAADAARAYQKALDLAPGHGGAFAGLGHQLKTLGRQAEAIEVYRDSIASDPNNAEPYWSLANMKTFQFSDEEIQAMEKLLANGELEDLGAVQICNALGFAYEARRDFDQAFSYFHQGNETRRSSEAYDPVETEVVTDRQIDVFSTEFIRDTQGHGASDPAPIFIVGLPRSGSTLIEQILASHSQVDGTHELGDLPAIVQSIPTKRNERFPSNLLRVKPHLWSKMGEEYLRRTSQYRQGSPRFIDKNPNNFGCIGFIHMILPNAKIINARRHPMDSCFGSYKQLFAKGQPFTYDLTEVGEYYLQYQRLMDHWHEVLPGRVLDVQYEEVVEDLERQVHRILDFCDLPFEQNCVEFHQTERAVKTASSEQVRQPIYSSSVNLWKNYKNHLSELVEVLEPVL